MFQNKNIKLCFITFLLLAFATDSMACVLSFQIETRSKFSKWMSQQVLVQAVENHLENNTNRIYQVQYKEFPFSNIRHTSNWVSYDGLMQFVEALKKLSIHAGIHPATRYRIRYKPKSSNQAETAQAPETKTETAQDAKPTDIAARETETAQDTKPETAPDTVAQAKVPPEVLDQKVVDYLDLGTRLNRVLTFDAVYNITTVRDLISFPETELLKIPDVGKASVEKIKAQLAEKGLALSEYDSVVPPL